MCLWSLGKVLIRHRAKLFKKCLEILRNYFDGMDIKIYPLGEQSKSLADAGVYSLTIYQETPMIRVFINFFTQRE
jgi:hypothetical protein